MWSGVFINQDIEIAYFWREKKTCKVTKLSIKFDKRKTRHTSCHIYVYVSCVTLLVKVFSKTADMWEDEINHDDEVVSVKSKL